MDKFQNKYRIQSARLKNWDYGWNGSYFLTVCTQNRECFFGVVIQGEMKLSEIGKIAEKYLLEIPERYEYAILDEFTVMPNHIHAIVTIKKTNDVFCRDAINRVSTENQTNMGGITGNKNPMLHDNISRIMNWYTGRVTFESRKINKNYGWQARFHDHVIHDNAEYLRIKDYIRNNPKNGRENDKLNNQL